MDETAPTYSCNIIYNRCLHLLKATVSACSTIDHKPKDIFILKQSWGRLVLWDEVFQDQNLDETLNKSPILRDAALRLFCEIGLTLSKGKLFSLYTDLLTNSFSLADVIPLVLSRRSETQEDDLQDLADKMSTELKEATMVTREYYAMAVGDGEEEDTDWDELETHRNPPHTLSIAAEAISFHVSHLLSLQPTIESLLRFYLCHRESHTDAHNCTELSLSSVPLHREITHIRDDNDHRIRDGLEGDSGLATMSSTQYSRPEISVQNRAEASEMAPRYIKAVFEYQNELR
jgi:hypothetical protein